MYAVSGIIAVEMLKGKTKLTDTENSLAVVRGGLWRWVKWVKRDKRYKLLSPDTNIIL